MDSLLPLLLVALGSPGTDEPRFQDVGLGLSDGPAAFGDIDGDGWVDLNAGGQLWHNTGGVGLEHRADGFAGLFGDFDGDGDLDLFAHAEQRLFHNDGRGAFAEVDLGELPRTRSLGAALGDFDGDGHLDAYVGGYEDWEVQRTFPDHLLLGDGASLSLAWSDASARARGVTTCDFDADAVLDVYVSNYRLQPNRLLHWDGAGGMRDVAADLGALATSEGFRGGHSIGACWGDFDGDGRFDLFAGNFAHVDSRGDQPKSRFLRNAGAAFEDRGSCGLAYQESYASPAAADYDGDGDLDLYFTTVYATASFGVPNHPVLYRGDGAWGFEDVTEGEGLAGLPPTYQAAWADLDQDGDPDLVTAGKLFENRGPVGRWLLVDLGPGALGAQVRAEVGSRVVARQVAAGVGQGNADEPRLLLGLADRSVPAADLTPLELEVRWPGGERQRLRVTELDRVLRVERETR